MIWRSAQGRRAVYEALRVGRPLVEGGPALGWMARPNGSEQAQVDLYGTTCTEVSQTLGVDAANESGRSFRSGNFTCLSTAEGPGSPWAASWHGTYYTYDCSATDSQAAFNWGRHYAL